VESGSRLRQNVILREVSARYFPQRNPPASTLAGVTALATPDFMIEIEAIAAAK